jgi:hypothetical protein
VGLAWQGNPQFGGDRYRSVRLDQFRPLAEVPGVRLFSLQKGKGSEQLGAPTSPKRQRGAKAPLAGASGLSAGQRGVRRPYNLLRWWMMRSANSELVAPAFSP